jgi:hypothetical protein
VTVLAAHPAVDSFIGRYDEELRAVAPDGGAAAMAGEEPYAYYGTERSAARWENRVTYGSLHALMTFDALGATATFLHHHLGAGTFVQDAWSAGDAPSAP